MRRLNIVIMTLIAAALPTFAGDVSWDAHVLSYTHDLEFFQEGFTHQEGKTYFGQLAAVFGTASPAPGLLIGAGVLMDVQFGRDRDENWDAAEPYLFLESDLGNGILRFGNLDRRNQQLHHALIAPDLRYQRPADRGLAYRREGARTTTSSWIQWRTKERPDRRELFDVGFSTDWTPSLVEARSLTLAAEGHLVHRGGRLSAVGRIEESWGLLVGPVWSPRLSDSWTTEFAANVGATADRRWRHDGRGAEVRAAVRHGGFEIWGARWWSDGWSTMDGRPLYRDDDLFSWGARQTWRPGDLIDADFGFRIHQVDGDDESEFWLLLDLASLNAD